MSKRIKKKREFENRVRVLEAYAKGICYSLDCFGEVLEPLVKRVEELEERVNINAQSTNNRFDQLDTENKTLRQEIEDLKRSQKKSFFKRK